MHRVNKSVKFDFYYAMKENKHTKTTAVVTIGEESFSRTIKLYYKDKDDKSRARKIALAGALEKSPLSKDERAEVWKVYKERVNL